MIMPLSYIFSKCTKGYKLMKINQPTYMNDIKLSAKTDIEQDIFIQTRIYSQDIRIEFYTEKCVILIKRSGKREITDGKKAVKSGNNENTWRKEKLELSEILKVDTIKQAEI